ncbi:26S proteasome complex subunit [Diplodia seriata]|uniref:26S proteasome complex subunit SEM1 n=1 Tax=Diplodia seriata TaxID=420778 RepID=A0A0G2H5H6_9PEZI|nr:putative dss1 sem1 domain-containing protein [Diplodia seriata]OMP88185.1 putative 26S proteasome complex subunit sem-1 [Diplodia seriata]
MSGAAQGSMDTKKAVVSDADNSAANKDHQKPATALEEDDEFEDFPVEDWEQEDTELPAANTHLWEESWDDDDTSEDFSAQLKEELKKVESKRG